VITGAALGSFAVLAPVSIRSQLSKISKSEIGEQDHFSFGLDLNSLYSQVNIFANNLRKHIRSDGCSRDHHLVPQCSDLHLHLQCHELTTSWSVQLFFSCSSFVHDCRICV